jgi:hypothetical protein
MFLNKLEEGVCHTMAFVIYIKKYHLKAKDELWKLKIFHHCKNTIFKKSSNKETKILQDIIASTSGKFG